MKMVIFSVTYFLHRERAIVSGMPFHFFLKLSIGLLYPNVETYKYHMQSVPDDSSVIQKIIITELGHCWLNPPR